MYLCMCVFNKSRHRMRSSRLHIHAWESHLKHVPFRFSPSEEAYNGVHITIHVRVLYNWQQRLLKRPDETLNQTTPEVRSLYNTIKCKKIPIPFQI